MKGFFILLFFLPLLATVVMDIAGSAIFLHKKYKLLHLVFSHRFFFNRKP